MKTYLINQLIAFSYLLRFINSKIWDLNLTKIHVLNILKGNSKRFVHFGEITKNIYSTQHLTYFNKGFEYKTLLKYESYLFEGATVLDIGANIGLFSLLASEKIGKNGKILAFEPSLKTSLALIENIKLNNCNNVELFQLALSDKEGKINLVRNINSDDAFNHIENNLVQINENVIVDTIVDTRRLDSILDERKIEKVDLIKIDVEGAEYLVLKGFENFLKNKNLPVIIFECYEPLCRKFNFSVFDTLKYLSNFNYEVEQFDDYQWIAHPPKIK